MIEIVNKICAQLPEGWTVQLCMESGAAWVELFDPAGEFCILPDTADKTIAEQLGDALRMAKEKARA